MSQLRFIFVFYVYVHIHINIIVCSSISVVAECLSLFLVIIKVSGIAYFIPIAEKYRIYCDKSFVFSLSTFIYQKWYFGVSKTRLMADKRTCDDRSWGILTRQQHMTGLI